MGNSKRNIAIVCGGDSSEHDVSMRSAQGLFSFFDKQRYNVFIVDVKGTNWHVHLENGAIAEIDKNDFSFQQDGTRSFFDITPTSLFMVNQERMELCKATLTSSICPTPPVEYWLKQ